MGHITELDSRLRVVQFKRKEGKDIRLMNWQARPYKIALFEKLL